METAIRRAAARHARLLAGQEGGPLPVAAGGRDAARPGRRARDRTGRGRGALRRRGQRDERPRVPDDPARFGAAPAGRGADPADADRASRTMIPGRRILLADADAFYVAVARLVDPHGAGMARLLIVGGAPERRGVVTSASYEARAFGVHSAMPMARAVRLCPNATVVPAPWEACAGKSREIKDVLQRFTPAVEQASSDEFYVDLTGTEQLYSGEPLAATARRMREAVAHETALAVSIGGGTSKLVAKPAAGVAKPRVGTPADGVHVVAPGAELEFMRRFALADIPFIGPKFQERLAKLGLYEVSDVLRH